MKTKTLLFSLLFTTLTQVEAADKTMQALTRNDDHKPVIEEVTLTDLTSENSFDGEHFKIVKGKSNDAIKFDADEGLRLKAATVYFHLTKARNYFINHVKSAYVAGLPKQTIRIEHTNQFSQLGHFANDALEPQHNNALTVPAGQTPEWLPPEKQDKWGTEIWFRPVKRVNIKDIRVNNLANREFTVLMAQFRDQIHMQTINRFLAQTTTAVVDGTQNFNPFSPSALIRTVGASVVLEVGYQFIDPINKFFSRKWYWLDTAMIPEIIYHEYSHVALSDRLVLSHSTAVIEGMADFFAGQIANNPQLAMHIKKYNVYNGKNAKRKQNYMIEFEMTDYANTDFVFGLLWQLKKIVGDEKGEQFMFELRKKITTNSSIRKELIEGILQTCDEVCETPFVDKLKILKDLNLKGL